MLFHQTLEGYYKTNFALMQHHKYSLSEIENMMPFERQVYVSLLMQYLEQVKIKKNQIPNAGVINNYIFFQSIDQNQMHQHHPMQSLHNQ